MSAQEWILLVMQASIMISVVGIGLEARLDDALYLLRQPWLFVRSLLAMFVVVPLAAIVLVKVFDFHRAVEIAIVALALSPVPPLLTRKQAKAGARSSYGLGLMVTMAILSIVVVPVGIHLLSSVFDRTLSLPPIEVAKLVAKSVFLPLALGMVARRVFPGLAMRVARPVAILGFGLLVAVSVLILVASERAVLGVLGDGTLPALLAFIVAGVVAGHWLGGPEPADRAVLGLSTASRHPGIAMAMASFNFPGEPGVPAAFLLYLLLNLVVSIPYVRWQRGRNRGDSQV